MSLIIVPTPGGNARGALEHSEREVDPKEPFGVPGLRPGHSLSQTRVKLCLGIAAARRGGVMSAALHGEGGILLCRAGGIRGWLVCCEVKRGFKARK